MLKFSLLLFIVSCAQQTKIAPAMEHTHLSASKYIRNNRVCFDIILTSDTAPEYAEVTNWTAVWMDQTKRYHFLTLNLQHPALSAEISGTHWTQKFMSCATGDAGIDEVKSLVLTPKEFPYNKDIPHLEIKWN